MTKYLARHGAEHSEDDPSCKSKQHADSVYFESSGGEFPLGQSVLNDEVTHKSCTQSIRKPNRHM